MEMRSSKKLSRRLGVSGSVMVALMGLTSCTWDSVEPEFCFKTEILPVFVSYCSTSGCHNPTDRTEDYDFTTYAGIMDGVKRGRPEDSDIVEAMLAEMGDEDHMPPQDQPQPSSEQITLIQDWIRAGAENTERCGGGACDTSAVATYSGDIQPMFQTFCNGCHGSSGASGGLNFSDFATVKLNAENGRIQGAISGDPAYTTMPPNSALLPNCYVVKINQWVAAGAQQN
jgi:hypothetical protein